MDKKIQLDAYELKNMAETLTSMAGRLLAICETEKAKKETKEDKPDMGKAALILKLREK